LTGILRKFLTYSKYNNLCLNMHFLQHKNVHHAAPSLHSCFRP